MYRYYGSTASCVSELYVEREMEGALDIQYSQTVRTSVP